jgi:hypothetical protein
MDPRLKEPKVQVEVFKQLTRPILWTGTQLTRCCGATATTSNGVW